MAKTFDSVPEGNGSMLDNTVIVYMSCSSDDHHCEGHDWPFVLLRGMNKRLKMGRYIDYPKYGNEGHQTVGSLYLALMQAGGRFGDAKPIWPTGLEFETSHFERPLEESVS